MWWSQSDLWCLHISFKPPTSTLQGIDSCSKSQEILDQAWRDSIPRTKCCQNLDLNNISRATNSNSLCSVKWIRKWCQSVLIDFWAMHDGSAPASYTSQCIRHHYIFIGFEALHSTYNRFKTIATMRTTVNSRRSWSWCKSVHEFQRSTVGRVWFLFDIVDLTTEMRTLSECHSNRKEVLIYASLKYTVFLGYWNKIKRHLDLNMECPRSSGKKQVNNDWSR
jgi:hypothetical protein